jgi:MFS superfamily sulfate permease-like transporter
VLVFVGYKLAHPKQFVDAYGIGKDEFLMMITTTTIVVAEDLLFGVIAGCIVGLIIAVVRRGSARNSDPAGQARDRPSKINHALPSSCRHYLNVPPLTPRSSSRLQSRNYTASMAFAPQWS